MNTYGRAFFHFVAWAGHISRGVILGIIGYFICKTAWSGDEKYYVNTDKAFDFLGDDVGYTCYILVAAGTICYGLFMFMFGYYYDSDAD